MSKSIKRNNTTLAMAVFLLGIFMGALDSGIISPARGVIDGNILTARGMGTAVDLGLALVEYLQDESSAINLGIELQYLEESEKELFK